MKTDILIADRAYDMNDTVEYTKKNSIEIVISPKSNRKLKRNFDGSLSSRRHIIENTFLIFKRWGTSLFAILKLLLLLYLHFLFVLFPYLFPFRF